MELFRYYGAVYGYQPLTMLFTYQKPEWNATMFMITIKLQYTTSIHMVYDDYDCSIHPTEKNIL